MIEIAVVSLAQIRRESERSGAWITETFAIEGTVDVPPRASWEPSRGDRPGCWCWYDAEHVTDLRCPTCAVDGAACPQRVYLYPAEGHLVVVHEDMDPLDTS